MSQNRSRQPTGAPGSTGGQFAPTARTTNGTALPTRTPANLLGLLTDQAFPSLADTDSTSVISRVEAQRSARKILTALTEESFNTHWYAIEAAAMQYQRFADDVDGDEAGSASPADTQGVDLGAFFGIEGPDRAGENGYGGYDYVGFAAEVAAEWQRELGARLDQAAAADSAAQVVTGEVTAA